jgi:hypothetical protein
MKTRTATSAPQPDDEFFAKAGIFAVATPFSLAYATATFAWGGFVIMKIWNWFMPALFGLPTLTIAGAIAVSWVALAIHSRRPPAKAPSLGSDFNYMFVTPAIRLAFAWVLHWLVAKGYVTL